MDVKLKPCPFCGCEMIAAEICCDRRKFRIYCQGGDPVCLAEISFTFEDAAIYSSTVDFGLANEIMQELVDAWNRRANDETD